MDKKATVKFEELSEGLRQALAGQVPGQMMGDRFCYGTVKGHYRAVFAYTEAPDPEPGTPTEFENIYVAGKEYPDRTGRTVGSNISFSVGLIDKNGLDEEALHRFAALSVVKDQAIEWTPGRN